VSDAALPVGGRGEGGPVRRRSPLSRGLKVLDALRERPMAMKEVAELLGVNRSTAHRLLRELEDAGFVGRHDGGRHFTAAPGRLAGPRLALVPPDGRTGTASPEWSEVVYEVLRDLRDEVGESTMFTVPARDRMLYATFFGTDHPIGVHEALGSARPMQASAVGKAYLAALPAAALDVVLGRLDYSGGTENAAKGPFQLRDMLDEIRERGYAIDRDETFVGLSCVATCVVVDGRTRVGAAGVTGLTARFSQERCREYGAMLVHRLSGLGAR
jgi:DNA-binding IclR family transcriptional regulator